MYIECMQITWDKDKAAINLKKHGVAFESVIPVLSDDRAITIEDTDHTEQRFVTIGTACNSVLLVVVYCYPDATDTIQIISARKAHPHERKEYETGI